MSWWSRFSRTFRPGRHDEEIQDELEYHLAMKEREGVDARAARLRLGNPARLKEEMRAQGILTWLESLLRDFRYGLRQLRKTPTVTAVIVASLALGIGANSAIFNLVDAALLRPLPVKDPQSLRMISWTNNGWPAALCNMLTGDSSRNSTGEMHASSIARRTYRDLAGEQRGFAALIGYSDNYTMSVSVGKNRARQQKLQYVSANFFSGLGVSLPLGRSFSRQEARPGQPVLAVIGNRFWHSHFASREDVLGKMLRVNNVPVQIVGVAPAGFFGVKIGEWTDLYVPLGARVALSTLAKFDPTFHDSDTYWWVRMMARRKPGVGEMQATQELSSRFRHLVVPPGVHIDPAKIPKFVSSPGAHGFDPIGTDKARPLLIVLLMVGLILLIVCANVANLLLSRAAARQRESAVCLALGAVRLRLLRQYLVESLTLAAAGGLAGLFLSYWLSQAIQYFVRADLNLGDFHLLIDGRILGFTLMVSLVSALLFGLAPAWQLARASVHDALKANSRSVVSGRVRLPRVLVAVQIGLSFTLLVAAGLLGRSLTNLKSEKIGFNRQNLVYASVNPWSAGYEPEQVNQYVSRLRERLAAIPGVLRVAIVEERPLSHQANATWINIAGRSYHQDDAHAALINHVSDGFFKTLGIPLLEGRRFQPGDVRAKSNVVVVDKLFVNRFYPHQDPIGRRFGAGPNSTDQYRIVGVVGNSRYYTLRGDASPIMFQPYVAAARPGWDVNFAIRSALDTRQLARAVRKAASAIDPTVPVVSIKTQTELIDRLLISERLLGILSKAFGALALILAAIGLIGLMSYAFARRTNEIGIRMALGASRGDVIRMVLKNSAVLVALGVAIGVPGAFLIGRALKHTLFELQPADPATIAVSLVVLIAVAGVASWIPARRASRIDPMAALREE